MMGRRKFGEMNFGTDSPEWPLIQDYSFESSYRYCFTLPAIPDIQNYVPNAFIEIE